MTEPLLAVRDLVKHFPLTRAPLRVTGRVGRDVRGGGRGRGRPVVHALDGVSFEVRRGETLGIVGETGCGKTTVARLMMRLLEPTSGTVELEGQDITALAGPALLPVRRAMQMVFQDPYSSLNPRRSAGAIIAEPFAIHGLHRGEAERRRAAGELMERVGLNPEHHNRLPHQFSGGERQRIGIARALALEPRVLIADEPVSALDVSIQAQILNLLEGLKRALGLTLVLISHDLSVVRHMCDRVAVMYLGRVVELAGGDALFARPRHPYTAALLEAVPVPDPGARERGRGRRELIVGEPPSATAPPPGCRFHPRCAHAQARCRVESPELEGADGGDLVACHFPLTAAGPNRPTGP